MISLPLCLTGTLSGFKGAVNRSLLSKRLFSFFSVAQVLCNSVNFMFFPLGLASLILIIIINALLNYSIGKIKIINALIKFIDLMQLIKFNELMH